MFLFGYYLHIHKRCMSCIIYSKLKNIQPSIIQPGIWSKIKAKAVLDKTDFLQCGINDIVVNSTNVGETKHMIKQGFGSLVEINDHKYVITCYHVIGLLNMETTAFSLNKNNVCVKIKLDHVKSIPEFDISILKFHNQSEEHDFNFYTEQELNTKIFDIISNKGQSNMFLNLLSVSGLQESRLTKSSINISDVDLTHEDFIGHIIPKLPLVTFLCDYEFEDDKIMGYNIEGLSGSQIIMNNVPVCIVMSYSRYYKKFQSIPMIFVMRVVKSLLINFDNQVTSYNIPTVTKGGISAEGERLNVKYVYDDSPVSYYTSTNKSFSFKKGYCILKINGQDIQNTGKIYDDEFGCELNADTFAMIKSLDGKYCTFTVCTDTKSDKTVNIDVNIEAKNLNTLYNVKIFNDHKYLYWKGLTFVELSEELLIDLTYLYTDKFLGDIANKLKSCRDKRRYVVLIDVNKNIITTANCSIANKLPIIEEIIDDEKYLGITILQKVGTKHILSLFDLKQAIQNKLSKKLYMYYQSHNNTQIDFMINVS